MSFKDKSIAVTGAKRGLKKFSDFGGSWGQYKIYLAANGALSPELEAPPVHESKSAPKWGGVQWFGKAWESLTDDDKAALLKHIKAMDKTRALGYCKYLQSFCGYPDLSKHL